jgi:Mn-dependent DtxR family transcriptional regulator
MDFVMKINESVEDYLETILILSKKGAVRSVDIADEMDFARASVSIAMKKLREGDYIHVDENGYITLTATGRALADNMYERHIELTNWLVSLGVDRDTAAEDACKIEHVISAKSFNAMKSVCRNCTCKVE